jgi:hypothetical protein
MVRQQNLATNRTSIFSSQQPRIKTGYMKFMGADSKRLNQLSFAELFQANRTFHSFFTIKTFNRSNALIANLAISAIVPKDVLTCEFGL